MRRGTILLCDRFTFTSGELWMWVTENRLDEWVRGNAREAQGLVVELIWRLVATSVPQPKERRFPLGDSIGQHGPDGEVDTDLGFDPFVPVGRSFWEVGTNLKPGAKATSDYKDLVDSVPANVRAQSTFVFVTPLSGARAWEHTWKPKAQARWLAERRRRRDWKDVRVIDGTRLIDWLQQFPAVGLWFNERITGVPAVQVETPEQRWALTSSIGQPPPLVAQLFLANREEAREKIASVFAGDTQQAKLDTRYPDQLVDFVCAHLADLPPESRAEAAGRCVIVSGLEAWGGIVAERERLVLVADAGLDLSGASGMTMIQRARRNGHAVIFGGLPGGIPEPTSAPLRSPTVYQVEEALRTAGYSEQRAKSLSHLSGGNLGSLLRCLQNLSLLPAWAEDSAAAELAIATVLGAWNDAKEADRAAVEQLVGNSYGEWIGEVREAARRPGTPLVHQDGRWRFVPRFEGWYALGPRLFDEHLDRFSEVARTVLGERDPQFDLEKENRYAAAIYDKVLAHSRRLRRGIADTLALLGSHPGALTSCSRGKAETTAALTVRTLLRSADWARWAGLDDVMPLLAEASPNEFLDGVDRMLDDAPEVLATLFAQEGDGITGRTYMTGLLWGLETLAWDPAFFSRVALTLGEMASRDPGGRWANRAANSLREILLPWLPQTRAPIAQRVVAVEALLREHPAVGWKLLLALLPESHGSSTYTRQPAWRPMIPDDWTPSVTQMEYWEQVEAYTRIAIEAAKRDLVAVPELIGRWSNLPEDAQEDLYAYLDREASSNGFPDDLRRRVWSAVMELVARNRRFPEARWALKAESVDRLERLAERLTPTTATARHQRLFSERDLMLYEGPGDYEEQARQLDQRRQAAIAEVLAEGGFPAVVAFAETVDTPWRVGVALGQLGLPRNTSSPNGNTQILSSESGGTASSEVPSPGTYERDPDPAVDLALLPTLLATESKAAAQFVGGFIRGRFFRHGWRWVDSIDLTGWTPAAQGQFFAFLPFVPETWDRAERLLENEGGDYWTRVAANPYETVSGLERAVHALLRHGRPAAAVECLARMVHDHQPVEPALIERALLALVPTKELGLVHSYELVELIKALQADSRATDEELFNVEWAYLPLLGEHDGGEPKFLAQRLAADPGFFCELIRLVFRPQEDPGSEVEGPNGASGSGATEGHQLSTEVAPAVAQNAYRLLSEWRVPPGTQPNGDFNGTALVAWMDAMKRDAAASGRLKIAMIMAGHVLTHVPADPNGLWIDRAAAAVLNSRDADDLRDGFRTQTMNARGVHWVDPTGKPEDELAQHYERRAHDADAAGYSRLAATMREVAASYARDAERVRADHRAEV